MSQADSPNTTSPSRSTVLAGISVASIPFAVAVEKLLAANTDPAFAAIAAHHQAMRHETATGRAVDRVLDALPGDQTTWHFMHSPDRRTPPHDCADAPEWIKVQQDMSDAYARRYDAVVGLLTTEPTTLAGAVALLEHVGSPEFPWEGAHTPILFAVVGRIDKRIAPAAHAFPSRLAAAMRRLTAAA
jgi:hypothetical protein